MFDWLWPRCPVCKRRRSLFKYDKVNFKIATGFVTLKLCRSCGDYLEQLKEYVKRDTIRPD